MSTVTISVRVSPEIEQRLAALADATSRSKSYLAAEAIEEYLAVQEWQVAAIGEALGEIERDEGVDHAEIKARWERLADSAH